MIKHFSDKFKEETGKDINNDSLALTKLRIACNGAKHTLSFSNEVVIEIDSLYEGVNFKTKCTRALFEQLCMDLFKRCFSPLEKVFTDSRIDKSKVHEGIISFRKES
jgi:L1 cell adhesion molecule like protein